MTKYKVGDVIKVTDYWDQGDEHYESGILLITEYEPPWEHASCGAYYLKPLEGNISIIGWSTSEVDTMENIELLGNINVDKALWVLYGNNKLP